MSVALQHQNEISSAMHAVCPTEIPFASQSLTDSFNAAIHHLANKEPWSSSTSESPNEDWKCLSEPDCTGLRLFISDFVTCTSILANSGTALDKLHENVNAVSLRVGRSVVQNEAVLKQISAFRASRDSVSLRRKVAITIRSLLQPQDATCKMFNSGMRQVPEDKHNRLESLKAMLNGLADLDHIQSNLEKLVACLSSQRDEQALPKLVLEVQDEIETFKQVGIEKLFLVFKDAFE